MISLLGGNRMTLQMRKEFTADLAKLCEAIAVSRELLITSKSLIDESKEITKNSRMAIKESHMVLNKSKYLHVCSTPPEPCA